VLVDITKVLTQALSLLWCSEYGLVRHFHQVRRISIQVPIALPRRFSFRLVLNCEPAEQLARLHCQGRGLAIAFDG
jgi:hypothetical protein